MTRDRPRYSPDGSQILYIARQVLPVSVCGGGFRRIAVAVEHDEHVRVHNPGLGVRRAQLSVSTGLSVAQRKSGLSTGGVRDWDEQGLGPCLNLGDSRSVRRASLQTGAFRAGSFHPATTGGGLEEYRCPPFRATAARRRSCPAGPGTPMCESRISSLSRDGRFVVLQYRFDAPRQTQFVIFLLTRT